ncbi:MAG: hypothetical protein HXS48_10795 [Theionarchaea archaeon]|nr:MAG: hypothetical protein AYK19_19215 [Theionarchaea archaeon DG-70-1]MBU7027413.1 hypothetical protein [Theionarchaea archaeon]
MWLSNIVIERGYSTFILTGLEKYYWLQEIGKIPTMLIMEEFVMIVYGIFIYLREKGRNTRGDNRIDTIRQKRKPYNNQLTEVKK